MMRKMTGMPKLERVAFFPGQKLTAADLTEAQRVLREMRWLHNRSLHSWGIVLDLDVSGEKNEAMVNISAGFAMDCLGREIILTEPKTLSVPATAGAGSGDPAPFLLTISYPEDDALAMTEKRSGICLPGDLTRLLELPCLRWLPFEECRNGVDIILARAWVKNCRLARPLSFNLRCLAKPVYQPYIASGQTDSGSTDWEQVFQGDTLLGFATLVDTSAARFNGVPDYQAHIMGGRLAGSGDSRIVIDGWTRISAASRNSFRLTVMLPQGTIAPEGLPLNRPRDILSEAALMKLGWHVVWMGIEGM